MAISMMPERRSTTEEEIWEVIRNFASPLTLSPALEDYLDDLIQQGVQKVKFELASSGHARTLEAKENFGLLIQTMKSAASPGQVVMDISDAIASLRKLCPLFPIC